MRITFTYSQKLFLGLLATICIGVVMYVFDSATPYIHSVINIFAGGRSTSKTYAFLAYLFILFLIALFTSVDRSSHHREHFYKKTLITAIMGLFGIGFLALLYFLGVHGFGLNEYIAAFHNGEFSSTSIAHNHVGKGVFGYALSYLGYENFESIDAGHAFIGMLPGWFYALFGLLLLISVIAAFAVFTEECRKKHLRILYILMYAMLSFGVIEHTFDGGLFDPRVPILLIFLLTLLYGISKKQIKTISIIFILSWVLAFTYMKLGILSEEDSYNRIILSMVAYIGFFGVPFVLLHGKITNQFKLLLIILGISITIPFLIHSNSIQDYRKISTLHDSSYVAVYPSEKLMTFPIIDTFGTLTIYNIPAGTFKNVEGILSTYNLMDNISPVSVLWNTCFPKGGPTIYTFTLLSKEPLSSTQKETPLSATFVAPTHLSKTNGFYQYDAVMKLEACTPRQVNILEETIKELGAHTFFISNIQNVRYTAPTRNH